MGTKKMKNHLIETSLLTKDRSFHSSYMKYKDKQTLMYERAPSQKIFLILLTNIRMGSGIFASKFEVLNS